MQVDIDIKPTSNAYQSAPSKTVYIEEQVKVLEKIIIETDPILIELTTLLNDFE